MTTSTSPHGGAATEAAAVDHLHGYSPLQVETVFKELALRAYTLGEFLQAAAGRADSGQDAPLRIAEFCVAMIGSTCDQMAGGIWIGSPGSWLTGEDIERPE